MLLSKFFEDKLIPVCVCCVFDINGKISVIPAMQAFLTLTLDRFRKVSFCKFDRRTFFLRSELIFHLQQMLRLIKLAALVW
jgi:hypothetical protein